MFRAETTWEERCPKVSQRKEYVNCLKVITLKTNKRRVIIVAKNSKNKGSKNTGINTKSVLRPGHGGRQRLSRRKG